MNTDLNPVHIQEGMDVYDSAGSKIGSVADIYFDTDSVTWNPPAGTTGATGTDYQNTSSVTNAATTATMTPPPTTGSFKVTEGGILGIGAKDLYFPFDAVTSIDPGACLSVSCAKGECDDRYGEKPDWIH